MKEENIDRAKAIQSLLRDHRGRLAVLRSNNFKHVGITFETQAIFDGYNTAKFVGNEIPAGLKDVMACLLKSDIEQKIKALEEELATL